MEHVNAVSKSGGAKQGPGPALAKNPPRRKPRAETPVSAPPLREPAPFNFARIPTSSVVQCSPASGFPAGSNAASPAEVQAAAIAGISEPGHPLPHRATIQRSFGRHNLSDVLAHTGASARSSTKTLHAEAFAHGRHVVFASSPGVRLAAHEAAHVVQQRAGLQLANGLGQRDDPHEAHAERVADAVLSGRSSERLLDTYAPAGRSYESTQHNVQRFESEEHQHLGNVATGSRAYVFSDPAVPGDSFELTHGDILALCGDVFPAAELFQLAARAGDHGQRVGTRDEVVWGLVDPSIWEMRAGTTGPGPYTGTTDPRFAPTGKWGKWNFSTDVKRVVLERYQKLAAANASHFASPKGRDRQGNPIATPDSAGSNFRSLHEGAIKEAYSQGVAGGKVDMGLAHEAAAQHFLTDAFSAGHLRTPIASIREYWGKRYPLFWYNLRHKIALDTAVELTKGKVIPNYNAYAEISAVVEQLAPSLPAITFGDLLAKVFHDVDNEQGLNIKGGGKVYGDAHLDAATEKLAVTAIQAGNKDIEEAFQLGARTQRAMPDFDLFAKIRPLNGGTKDKYAAELQMPTPDKNEPPQNWKASDASTLWNMPLLGKAGTTIGAAISKTVQGGAIGQQLTGLSEKFDVDAKLGYLHPRAAYLNGFVAKLQGDPAAGVQDIVAWAPHDMMTGSAPREMVQDLLNKEKAGDKKENLTVMTMAQRVNVLKQLVDDARPKIYNNGSPKDQDMVLEMFQNLGHAGRLELFHRLENRDWDGDFSDHWYDTDELLKTLKPSPAKLARLKRLLNGK